MFSIVNGKNSDLPNVSDFLAKLEAFDKQNGFFETGREIFFSRAPGRLDLMGGIADYSGSLVLQYPIREATFAAIQKTSDAKIKIFSRSKERETAFKIELAEFDGKLSDYNAAREFFRQNPKDHWAAYIIGVFLVLKRERGIDFRKGARIFIVSDVPEGKGVSSSAALEVATMQAVSSAFGIDLNCRELALLCQKVENEIVGAPCGVMDQMVSSCGEENRLLALRCQPAELLGTINLPEEIEIWGIDSGVKHSVAGADYGQVRAGAFIGYRIIAEIAGLQVETLENNLVEIKDDRWKGFLANITPAEFEENFRAELPEKITGAEFLKNFHGTTDRISTIESETEYAVLAPTAHPIYENYRVQRFAEILQKAPAESQFHELGELMYQSHRSYSNCGLGSDGTGLLVELVRAEDLKSGLYGAKITGGGSGGTVAVLGRRGAGDSVAKIARLYDERTGKTPLIFSGSSPGAARFGFVKLLSHSS